VARRQNRRTNFTSVEIVAPGQAGLDLDTEPIKLPKEALSQAENVRTDDQMLSRRKGARKIAFLGDATLTDGSWAFPVDTDYGEIPYASHLSLPAGGFWRRVSFIMQRPANPTGHVVETTPGGASTERYLSIVVNSDGTINSQWAKQSDGLNVVNVTQAFNDNDVIHLLDIFDPVAGTFTTWVNGVQEAQTTGLLATERPFEIGSPITFGQAVEPGVGPVTGTEYAGDIDAFTYGSLRGVDVQAVRPNGMTMEQVLLKYSLQTWPNPESAMVALHCGFDEPAGSTVLVDASRHRNHGTLNGAPVSGKGVAQPAICGQLVATMQENDAERLNLVAGDGVLYYETTKEGAL
jgi:hypothetical protein